MRIELDWIAIGESVCPFAVVTAMAITKATEFKLKLHSASLHTQAKVDPVIQFARAAEHVAVCKHVLDGAQIPIPENKHPAGARRVAALALALHAHE